MKDIKQKMIEDSDYPKSKVFRDRIHNLIPGGSHTYSKGDDQFPELAPAAISHGKGAWVWDIDGNKFLDCSMGLSSVSLGHAFDYVNDRVKKTLDIGVNFQRPALLELEMAEKFLDIVPQHQMVKFAKNGSAVTTAAVKLARAYTDRKLVAFPGDHPFYSYDDWFIGKTNCNKGVPEEFSNLSVTFDSCNLKSLEDLFLKYPNQIACVITEPEKNFCGNNCKCGKGPEIFLKEAIELTHKHGALFIIDEMVTGFKTAYPGTITKYYLDADMATWGKGIANGFAFCALTGKRDIMELGGIRREGDEKVFLISTTHGGETHALEACLATIEYFKEHNVIEHNHTYGDRIIEGTCKLIDQAGLTPFITVSPSNWMPAFVFKNKSSEVDSAYRTLFLQEMIKRGVLFQGIVVPTISHDENELNFFLSAFEDTLIVYREAIENGTENYLIGKAIKPVFRKYI